MVKASIEGVEIQGDLTPEYKKILSNEALNFIADLHRRFNPKRLELLKQREERQQRFNQGEKPGFLAETEAIRKDSEWKVASTPPDLVRRRVEITGPTDRKMMINALNSGADIFMADLEDSTSPTWQNIVEGQINLIDAVNKTISFSSPEGKKYDLNDKTATLLLRPRGWHLNEKHILIDGEETSGSLVDFGLYFFHNAHTLLKNGTGPYFYLPKLQSHLEARLWNEVFIFAQEKLGIDYGTIRATVLIETILAVFEMEEILYELRHHISGLNAGRWDYIFSAIKTFRRQKGLTFPDRIQVSMTVPFMRAYTELLVRTCHKRGAHAMGGMSAFIPNRRDPEVTEEALTKVREDKRREATDGFDGTWVAHPDLVPIAMNVFNDICGMKANQKEMLREDVNIKGEDLLNFKIAGGKITETGLRLNINVGIQYIASWLRGTGAAAIFNMMEDAATAEISRAQIWQWLHAGASLDSGEKITQELIIRLTNEEIENIKSLYGNFYQEENFAKARSIFEQIIFSDHFIEFLTLIAYKELP